MELNHVLEYGSRVFSINEPIGFDNFKVTFSRGEYHGMSVEASAGSLEFYDIAADVIMDAYENDIDSVVTYRVSNGTNVVYEGVVDLSTIQERSSEYHSVSAKVGDVGAKTTFNNRADTPIDLNTKTSVDGVELDTPARFFKVTLPERHFVYTNNLMQRQDSDVTLGLPVAFENRGVTSTAGWFLSIHLDTQTANEFGTIGTTDYLVHSGYETSLPINFADTEALFETGGQTEFVDKFGSNTKKVVDVDVSIQIKYSDYIIPSSYERKSFTEQILVVSGPLYHEFAEEDKLADTNVLLRGDSYTRQYENSQSYHTLRVHGSFETDGTTLLWIGVWIRNNNIDDGVGSGRAFTKGLNIQFSVQEGSYVRMRMMDSIVTQKPVQADCCYVSSALTAVCQAISDNALTMQSSWFGPGSGLQKAGGGRLKCITNGYKIRGLFTDEYNERNMPVSFKDLIESLNAIDCIGWCFDDNNGAASVRIERWDWFYKNDVILEIVNPKDVQRDVNAESVVSSINIGYKKYTTQDEYNSIDSPHGERTFISKIKAINGTRQVLCDFIADTYAIEETRRASFQKDKTEEFKYDESIFILELAQGAVGTSPYVPTGVLSSSGFETPDSMYNLRITPWHNACRWKDYLFKTNSECRVECTSGTINYNASFKTDESPFVTTLQIMGEADHTENQPIESNRSIIKAETITFTYPISLAEYKSIKANPYGIVMVNGKPCWIKEVSYSFVDGEAEFKLIPKYIA